MFDNSDYSIKGFQIFQPIGSGYHGETVNEVSSVELDHEEVVCVREFCGPDAEDKLRFVRRLRHHNLVNMLDIFRNRKVPDKVTVTFEFLPITVIDTCDQAYKHLNELRLAAIVGQASTIAMSPSAILYSCLHSLSMSCFHGN
ncbi:kinase domain-containing protein [Metarhizium brunneum]